MITKVGYALREEMLEYLQMKQFSMVVDVGGSLNPWTRKYVTHYIDLFDPKEYHQDPLLNDKDVQASSTFIGDICLQNVWDDVLTYVGKYSKFDYAICCHTLEDIRNPELTLKYLPRIAKEGFIAEPNKFVEMSKTVESYGEKEGWGFTGAYRGYCHHRWIFTIIDNKFIAIPKLNFIECLNGIEQPNPPGAGDLSFFWKDDIPFEFMNSDFLGPNPPAIFDLYRKYLNEGL